MIILDINIDLVQYALDNNYEHWWSINKGTHYEFYYE
jgi:hypothetical protein